MMKVMDDMPYFPKNAIFGVVCVQITYGEAELDK